MLFLHDSELHFHGNLKSSNCVVTSCWTLQVADYGLLTLRHSVLLEQDTTDEYVRCKSSFPFMSSLELLFLFLFLSFISSSSFSSSYGSFPFSSSCSCSSSPSCSFSSSCSGGSSSSCSCSFSSCS